MLKQPRVALTLSLDFMWSGDHQYRKDSITMRIVTNVLVLIGWLLIIVVGTLTIVGIATAGVTCQTDESGYTYCWNSDSGKHTTCQTVNGYTYCS